MSVRQPGVAQLVCAGCGERPRQDELLPFRCARATEPDDTDHVLRRQLDLSRIRFARQGSPNPYLRYRECLYAYQAGLGWGLEDVQFAELMGELDHRITEVDGRGFVPTPLEEQSELARQLGLPSGCRLWVKDETHNVGGSHKARHLMSVALYLRVLQQTGRLLADGLPPLAIASCGNAAVAAAVLARALDQPLDVYVPPDASSGVLSRLQALGARLTSCPRRAGEFGDPCYHRFGEALARGAVPFSCQGNQNGLAVEGGQTLVYELVEQLVGQGAGLDRLVIQVGGGALASACVHGLNEAVQSGLLGGLPRIHAVQTESAAPLVRAHQRVSQLPGLNLADPASVASALSHAATHRSDFMWPWETEPRSLARGILDDETYDWLAVVEGMLRSGGSALTVDESQLQRANELAQSSTGVAACHTGTAGLAGLMKLVANGELRKDEHVCVIFTGAMCT